MASWYSFLTIPVTNTMARFIPKDHTEMKVKAFPRGGQHDAARYAICSKKNCLKLPGYERFTVSHYDVYFRFSRIFRY